MQESNNMSIITIENLSNYNRTMKKYIFILLAAMTFVACNDDENNFPYEFRINEQGTVTPLNGLNSFSEENFQSILPGHGWYATEEYWIDDDGKVDTERNLCIGMIGANPLTFYLDNENLTEFIWMDHIPASVFKTRPYRYSESTNLLLVEERALLTILSYDADEDKLIALEGACGRHLLILKRMDEQTLQTAWKHHSTNYDDIHQDE